MEFKKFALYRVLIFLILTILVVIIGNKYLITPTTDENRLVHKDDISVDAALKSIGSGIKAMKFELDNQKIGVMVDKIELTLNLNATQTEDGKTKLTVAVDELTNMGVNINKATNDNKNSSIKISFKSVAQHDLDLIKSIRGMSEIELQAIRFVNIHSVKPDDSRSFNWVMSPAPLNRIETLVQEPISRLEDDK